MIGKLIYGTDQMKVSVEDWNRDDSTITIKSDWCGKLDYVEVDGDKGIITVHMKSNNNEKFFDEEGNFIQDNKDENVIVKKV